MASAKPSTSAATKMVRLNRLRDLELKMNEARKLNHKEVAAEEERKKRPANFEAKRKRVEWEEEQDKLKQECKEKGENYDLFKLRDLGAEEAEKWERKKKKKNPDTGFAGNIGTTFNSLQMGTLKNRPHMDEA